MKGDFKNCCHIYEKIVEFPKVGYWHTFHYELTLLTFHSRSLKYYSKYVDTACPLEN